MKTLSEFIQELKRIQGIRPEQDPVVYITEGEIGIDTIGSVQGEFWDKDLVVVIIPTRLDSA